MRALILAADGVEDCEFMYSLFRLREEGITVDVAAPQAGPLRGRCGGYELEANLDLFRLQDGGYYDLLLLPGGGAPERLRLEGRALHIVREMLGAGKVVAAIGHGPETLVSAGLLEGRRATCAGGIRDELKMAGADYEDSEVVVDRNLITARGPHDLPAFFREVMRAVGRG
jgi:protease I